MGCCASSNKANPPSQFHQSSRAPPPVDEETVKEVLSETPNPTHFNQIEDEPRKINPKKTLPKISNHPNNYNLDDNNFSGDVSEICSNQSESLSNTTFEEEAEILRRKATNRSPAKVRNRQLNNNNIYYNNNNNNNNNNSGELRLVRNSPVRGKQQSPGRVRSGSEMNNRGSAFGSVGRQRPMTGSGQVSRSRSPANRTSARGGGGGGRNGVGKSPSKRKTDNSPGRVGAYYPARVVKQDMDPGVGLGMGLEMDHESSWGPSLLDRNEDESLDNPLVSLECFIFL